MDRGRVTTWWAASVCLSLVLAACAADPPTAAGRQAGAATDASTTTAPGSTAPGPTAPGTTAPATSADTVQTSMATGTASVDACVKGVLAGLSLRQRVGQLFVVGIPAGTTGRASALDAAHDVRAGGYLVYGRWNNGITSLRRLTRTVDAVLAGRADGVVPFAAADQEGGYVQPLRGTGFDRIPTALTQGRLAPSTLRAKWKQTWGADLHSAGITVDFAPVADVVPASLGTRNQPIGRYYREFGHTPGRVAAHATAALQGIQDAGLMATAKHFPGLGRVIGNTDTTTGVTDRVTTPDDPYLRPFQAAVDAGVTFVMVSSAAYTKIDSHHKAVYSPTVMRLLRQNLGFTGLIVSDDLGQAKQVSGARYEKRGLAFLAAGGQVVVVVAPTEAVRKMTAGMVAAATQSAVVRARVNRAVRAVLYVKQAHGLLPGAACS